MTANRSDSVPLAILDFGSQFSHLISRRLRSAHFYCELFPPDVSIDELTSRGVKGVILSGGPSSVYDDDVPPFNREILDLPVPILGVCYGYQLMTQMMGGKVEPIQAKEFGSAKLQEVSPSALLRDLPKSQTVWMSHGDSIVRLPDGFAQVAATDDCPFAAAEDTKNQRFGVQFHPEVAHSEFGQEILVNFAKICGCAPSWHSRKYLDQIETQIRQEVGSRNVFLLVSGGIDSTVLFLLLNRVLGPARVKGMFVNTGLLRPGDTEMVRRLFEEHQISNYHIEDASKEFLAALQGVSDPELKRKVIGALFLDVKDRVIRTLNLDPKKWLLAQGTIYPDIITSGGSKHARVIKTHHNALPSLGGMEVLEPLRFLYKDEVRELADNLGFPPEFVWKHPFPGPGIAVRIAGVVNDSKIALYHKLDAIVMRHLQSSGWYRKLWMGFPVLVDVDEVAEKNFAFSTSSLKKLATEIWREAGREEDAIELSVLPIRSVGVKGDYRTYEHPVELRITSNGHPADLPRNVIDRVSKEITNTVPSVNRVLLTVSWRAQPDRWKKIVILRMLQSVDTLTSDWAFLEHDLLQRMGGEIFNGGFDIDAVLIDVTQKPPSTMEWE